MSLRELHVPPERLAALALIATREVADAEDHDALAHAATCAECGWHLARLTADLDDLRLEAEAEADAHFDPAALAAQRARIMDGVAALVTSPRVVRFPASPRRSSLPVGGVNRRWVSMAAAAGLIIGLLTGQLVHLLPGVAPAAPNPVPVALDRIGPVRPAENTPAIVQARATLSDEELLNEIDAAVQLRRAAELRALDALTPSLAEIR
ncbi:MAG: hypothetical protein AB7O67_11910 [Vicinamibacterales bacterium]